MFLCDLGDSGITLWFALLTIIQLAFSEKFGNFRFPQIFNNCYFSYDKDEALKQKFLEENLTSYVLLLEPKV